MPPTRQTDHRPRISPVALWIVFCAYCNCIGWILSALHELNAGGYAAALGLGFVALMVWKVKTGSVFFRAGDISKLRRRFRRPFPMAFLILAGLAILGGVLYAPTNYDGLAYREARVLHWLAEGRWHWIHTDFKRVNVRGCGIEWLSAPVMALLKTDRPLFLLNAISFLLLPGLIFSLFARLGVRPRVAWYWMWPLSCGYCFLLQAGSIGNDLFVVPFTLAAMDYALRSHQEESVGALRLSLLAAGMCVGVKANSLPLLLPYVIALAPGWRLWFKGAFVTAAVCVVTVLISFAPMALLNIKYTGDWTGGEVTQHLTSNRSLFVERLSGNMLIVVMSEVTPPIAPFAPWWNDHVAARLAQTAAGKAIDSAFEIGNATVFAMGEMSVEEGAGYGFGNFLLICSATAVALWSCRGRMIGGKLPRISIFFFAGTYIAFLVFMTTSYVMSTSRLLAQYYPLLVIPFFVIAGQSKVVRQRWWKGLAMATFAIAALPLIASPPRPLFPWKSTVAWLRKAGSPEWLVSRAETVYSVYSERADSFAPVIPLLGNERVVGLVTYDDPETALWRPFGSRRVVHVCHDDSGEYLRSRGIRYVVVHPEKFAMDFQKPFDQWLREVNGTRVAVVPLTLRAGRGTVDCPLVKLN